MRVVEKFQLEEKGKQKSSFIRSDLERKLRFMDYRQNISFCFPSEPVSMSDDFSSVSFTFMAISGFSLIPNRFDCNRVCCKFC